MSRAEFARAARRRIIAGNPSVITIHRVDRVPSGGGRLPVKSDVGPFTVRIYSARNATVQQDSSVAGVQQRDRDWSLIADDQADLRAGANVTDEFDAVDLGHFRILDVHPQRVDGELVGYAAELERIS
jgi:hypothetical protein